METLQPNSYGARVLPYSAHRFPARARNKCIRDRRAAGARYARQICQARLACTRSIRPTIPPARSSTRRRASFASPISPPRNCHPQRVYLSARASLPARAGIARVFIAALRATRLYDFFRLSPQLVAPTARSPSATTSCSVGSCTVVSTATASVARTLSAPPRCAAAMRRSQRFLQQRLQRLLAAFFENASFPSAPAERRAENILPRKNIACTDPAPALTTLSSDNPRCASANAAQPADGWAAPDVPAR